jgi:hypothetical protein
MPSNTSLVTELIWGAPTQPENSGLSAALNLMSDSVEIESEKQRKGFAAFTIAKKVD